MTIKPFDQFNKNLFQQLLSPFGTVTPNRAVLGGERTIDILFEPDPSQPLNADELGNLATMSSAIPNSKFNRDLSPLSPHPPGLEVRANGPNSPEGDSSVDSGVRFTGLRTVSPDF